MPLEHTALVDSPYATVQRISADLIEVRFKADVKLDIDGISQVIQAKCQLCRTDEPNILAVLPPDLDFALNVLSVDHSAVNGGCSASSRLAFVAPSSLNRRLAEIYFRYYPSLREIKIFKDEDEARSWLN